MSAPLDQALALQAVNCHRDRATRQQDLSTDLVDGERPFMKQGFEHGEVTAAHFQSRDAFFGIGLNSTRRLPQHKENVDAAPAG